VSSVAHHVAPVVHALNSPSPVHPMIDRHPVALDRTHLAVLPESRVSTALHGNRSASCRLVVVGTGAATVTGIVCSFGIIRAAAVVGVVCPFGIIRTATVTGIVCASAVVGVVCATAVICIIRTTTVVGGVRAAAVIGIARTAAVVRIRLPTAVRARATGPAVVRTRTARSAVV
jgi:hypothetical protein